MVVLAFANLCATKYDASSILSLFFAAAADRSATVKSSTVSTFILQNSTLRSAREPFFYFRCCVNLFTLNGSFTSTSQHITTAAFHCL
jgi:hypothetical protein